MPYNNFPQVQDIINAVNSDIRQQMAGGVTADPGKSILIDFTNRIHKRILRFSRWGFLLSDPLYFLTDTGQSKYWLGAAGEAPAGNVDTGLNLRDVDKIKKDSVIDISNLRQLKWLSTAPYGPNLIDSTGRGRPGLPATFLQNPNEPNTLEIYPPSINQNAKQPVPQVPIVQTTVAGALPLRTYLIKVTYVDTMGGESTAPANGALRQIVPNSVVVVKSPVLPFGSTVSSVQYNQYNVYASPATIQNGIVTNEGNETLQNVSPISIGTDWEEPTTGLTTTGRSVPTTNTLQPIGAYIIKFQYYKNRATLRSVNDYLQVPEDYKDIVIQGVNALAFNMLGKKDEAGVAHGLFMSGLTEMICDKNLFPEGVEFMRPDGGSYVNNQILGILPPFF